jgi:hypothetical protein
MKTPEEGGRLCFLSQVVPPGLPVPMTTTPGQQPRPRAVPGLHAPPGSHALVLGVRKEAPLWVQMNG